jgi:sulfoxide reductase heme-binding subunit YedZ
MTRSLLVIKTLVFCACLAPFVLLVLRAFEIGGLDLGADPKAEVLKTCGMTGLNLLMLTLCVTPIRRATGINRLVTLRRMLGLFSFFYLCVHFLTYIGLYIEFDWSMLLEDIGKRPYITVGFTALMLMVPLAVTSTTAFSAVSGVAG